MDSIRTEQVTVTHSDGSRHTFPSGHIADHAVLAHLVS